MIATPILAIEKRSRELRPYSGALVLLRAKDIIGVIEMSLWRYIPSPAGLIDIDERSAPSDVNAPAMAMARAVPKLNWVCDNSAISPGIITSLSISRPPHPLSGFLAEAAAVAATAASNKITLFIVFSHLSENRYRPPEFR